MMVGQARAQIDSGRQAGGMRTHEDRETRALSIGSLRTRGRHALAPLSGAIRCIANTIGHPSVGTSRAGVRRRDGLWSVG